MTRARTESMALVAASRTRKPVERAAYHAGSLVLRHVAYDSDVYDLFRDLASTMSIWDVYSMKRICK